LLLLTFGVGILAKPFSAKECSFHIDYGLELLFHIDGATLPLARVTQNYVAQDNKADGRFQ